MVPLTGSLLVILAKPRWGGTFGTFWYGMEDFEESGPEQEISDWDLGSGGVGRMGRKGEMIEKSVQCLKNMFLNIEGGFRVEFLMFLENNNIEM